MNQLILEALHLLLLNAAGAPLLRDECTKLAERIAVALETWMPEGRNDEPWRTPGFHGD